MPMWTIGDALWAIGIYLGAAIALSILIGISLGMSGDMSMMEGQGFTLFVFMLTVFGMLCAMWYAHRKSDGAVFEWGDTSRPWLVAAVGMAILVTALSSGWSRVLAVWLGEPPQPEVIKTISEITDPVFLILAGVFFIFLWPVLDEHLMRGFVQPPFVRTFGTNVGIGMTAAIGTLGSGTTDVMTISMIMMAGCTAGWLRERTGGVGTPIAFSAAYTAMSMLIYTHYGAI